MSGAWPKLSSRERQIVGSQNTCIDRKQSKQQAQEQEAHRDCCGRQPVEGSQDAALCERCPLAVRRRCWLEFSRVHAQPQACDLWHGCQRGHERSASLGTRHRDVQQEAVGVQKGISAALLDGASDSTCVQDFGQIAR